MNKASDNTLKSFINHDTDNMEITEAYEADYVHITSLYYELYPKRYVKKGIPFNGIKTTSKVFVARVDSKVVGFIIATFIKYSSSSTGYLEELVITEKYRNKGFGRALVETALRWENTLGAEVVFVTTDEAQEFYKKLGFEDMNKNSWLCWIPKKV